MSLPRNVAVWLRSELRALTGHSLAGFASDGSDVISHSRVLADGSCLTCRLVGALDEALSEARDGDVEPEVFNLGSTRRVADLPPGYALGRGRA